MHVSCPFIQQFFYIFKVITNSIETTNNCNVNCNSNCVVKFIIKHKLIKNNYKNVKLKKEISMVFAVLLLVLASSLIHSVLNPRFLSSTEFYQKYSEKCMKIKLICNRSCDFRHCTMYGTFT